MSQLDIIREPIEKELSIYQTMFENALQSDNKLLSEVLSHIRNRRGKMMRPILVLLSARNWGSVSKASFEAAVALEILHTASLVHDDVVDESNERRGQKSVNALYDNKLAVLVGDYMLSTSLQHASLTDDIRVVRSVSELGRALSQGEILQLSNIQNSDFSEKIYYDVIRQKTAALFASCTTLGCLTSGAPDKDVEKARKFGEIAGICFQIRDDIFDYYDSQEIGKPTGNDMIEGKLTLPVIYALNSVGNERMLNLGRKVRRHEASADEIAELVRFAKENGGIEYAEMMMEKFRSEALDLLSASPNGEIKDSLIRYVDYIVSRNK